MNDYNQCGFTGRLVRDPELKRLQTFDLCTFTIAVNESWTDKTGTKRDKVLFLDCKVFGKPASWVVESCRKGSAIFVSGSLETESWEGKDGQKRSRQVLNVKSHYPIAKREQPSSRDPLPADDWPEEISNKGTTGRVPTGDEIPF